MDIGDSGFISQGEYFHKSGLFDSGSMGAGRYLTRHPESLARIFALNTAYMPQEGDRLAVAGWQGHKQVRRHRTKTGNVLRTRLIEEGWSVVNDTPLPLVCFSNRRRPGDMAAPRDLPLYLIRGYALLTFSRSLMEYTPVGKSNYPSRAYLSKMEKIPASILEHLIERFPRVGGEVWKSRVKEGAVFFDDGAPISESTPYQPGKTVLYFREVRDEPQIPFQESIVFRNEQFLVADKPHFMPVTPSGSCVNQCLLSRLRTATGVEELTPVHRLDRETAGLVLFALRKETRGLFHRMFESGIVHRQYLAAAAAPTGVTGQEWLVENRLIRGEPWFRMKISEGEKNAVTRIVFRERRGDIGLFELYPGTGKKHQLRVHLASLGFPVLNDPFYPELLSNQPRDYSKPLALVAKRLSFPDPITGHHWDFESEGGV